MSGPARRRGREGPATGRGPGALRLVPPPSPAKACVMAGQRRCGWPDACPKPAEWHTPARGDRRIWGYHDQPCPTAVTGPGNVPGVHPDRRPPRRLRVPAAAARAGPHNRPRPSWGWLVNATKTPRRQPYMAAWRCKIARAVRLLALAARRGAAAELEWMRAELDLRMELAILYIQGDLRVSGSPSRLGPGSATAIARRHRRRAACAMGPR
jgi:hypothetical protein